MVTKIKNDDYIYLSIYKVGINPTKYSFLTKLKHIWQIIKGRPYEDQLILDKNTAKKLAKELNAS